MWNPKTVQGPAWKFGLAAVTVGLMAGCGGSSSGDGGNGGGETATLSDEEAAAVAIASIGGAENYTNLSLAFAPDDVDFDGDQLQGASVLATQAGLKAKELEAQQTEQCDSGSVTINETTAGFVVDWNQCQFSTGDGGAFYMDGIVTYAEGSSPLADFTELLEANFDAFDMDVTFSNDDRFAMSLDGSLAIHWNASPQRTLAVFDFGAMSSIECGGISDQFDALMDVSIRADDTGDGTDMEVNGRVENDGARVDVETTRTIYTPDGTIYPEDGVFVATHGGSTTTVEFVQGGLNVDGTFYTWDEFEEEYLAEEENPAFSQCGV
ncbi:hypothetical protein [Thioalkalivibrio sp. ALE30]|uniref:hypothetical protein n=1 Tax=Thioalkalivibrio sp. ALE30 TaxID=1158181 RepID=UPI000399F7DC|nr:hypothetical protein [Thioalkalivibrio sp. ALE30]